MEAKNIDKATLKLALQELIKEDKNLFKEIITEILVENQVITSNKQEKRRKKIEQLLDLDFDEYDEVFKALA